MERDEDKVRDEFRTYKRTGDRKGVVHVSCRWAIAVDAPVASGNRASR